jgi:hypothetical protein
LIVKVRIRIGCVVLDPKNPLTVWVGTGENNSQRSVSYGNGVYRSDDGGKTWRNLGLRVVGAHRPDSRSIRKIRISFTSRRRDRCGGPAAIAVSTKPLMAAKTWKQVLKISENTGVTDVVIDPQNPETLYAASYQRRRHMFTLINGGPESAITNQLMPGPPGTGYARVADDRYGPHRPGDLAG